MMGFRFIDLDLVDCYYGPAVFDGIMKAISQDRAEDTLLFWRTRVPAVYIGYHQLAKKEVRLDECKKQGIPVIRRILGGGTGYCDSQQIIYNVIFRQEREDMPLGPQGVYERVLQGLVRALNRMGLQDTEIDEERYSLYVNGKKISGSGQLTSRGVVNSSGSFLVDFDFSTMNRVLPDPVKNLKGNVEIAREGMTFLKNEVPGMEMGEAKSYLKKGFEDILGETKEKELSPYEKELAEELVEKYKSQEWTLRADRRMEKRKRRAGSV